MIAIYKRELKSYFRSFIGLLFIAVTLFFVSLYFFVNNILNGEPYFAYAVAGTIIFFFISIPVLTMRILAEEKKNKTDQLILTAPVSVGGIVMGKFLALLTIFAIPTAVICVYPVVMSRFGSVPMAEGYVAILGFFLYGMTAIAAGVLVSSLTESQVISSVLTFILLFVTYMMSSICSMISVTGNLLTKLLGCLDMATPYYNMLDGVLDLSSVAYFISMTALLLFLTAQSIQKRRYSVSARGLSMGAYSVGMIAVAVAITVVVNLVVRELPMSMITMDVTPQKMYSLTDQTKEYVKRMTEDVTIYVIAKEEDCDNNLKQSLRRYDELSDHISVEYVDPVVAPQFVQQYTATESITMSSVIVVSEKRSKFIDHNSKLYAYNYDYDYYTGQYTSTVTGYDGEGQITSALDYVLADDMPKLYLTQGHGEYNLSANFLSALEKENVEYETINLLNYDAVPEDAACLVVNACTKDLSEADTAKITAYLERGGSVVMVTGAADGVRRPNLDALLQYMGLELVEGLIIEQNSQYYTMLPYYLLPEVESSVYTAGLYGNYYVFAPSSQGIRILDQNAGEMKYNEFLTTSDQAFSKVNITGQGLKKTENDIDGSFAVGLSAVKTLADGGKATMVVYGSDQIFTDAVSEMVYGANQVLFVNTVSSFVDHEVSVSIPPKSINFSALIVTQATANSIGMITVIVIPLGCLIVGFVIWFRRRKR